MKLPKVPNRTVQSMGRANLSAVGSVASAVGRSGQVDQGIFDQMAKLATDFIVRKENAEFNTQKTDMHTELMQFKEFHAVKTTYTAEEAAGAPNNAVSKTISTVDGKGVVVTQVNDEIPAYEVYPHLLEQQQKAMIKNKASKITNPRLREQFIQESEIIAANNNLRAGVAAADAQRKYLFDVAVYDARKQATAGDLVAAEYTIENMEADPLVKQKLTDEIKILDEMHDVNLSIHSTDQEAVLLMERYLSSHEYEGYLSEPLRQAAIRDLTAQLKFLGANAVDEADRQHGIRFVNMTEQVKTGNSSLAEIQEGFDKFVVDENDAEGWDAAQYSRLMDLQRGYESSVLVEERRQAVETRRVESARITAEKAGKVEFDKAYKQQNGLFFSHIEALTDAGEFTNSDLEQSYEQFIVSLETGVPNPNTINEDQRTIIRRRIETVNKKRVADTQNFMSGKAIVEGKIPGNRENGDHQRDVDQYVKDLKITNVGQLVNITQDTNIMPQPLEDAIVHSALNLKDSEAIPGLAAYGAILENKKQGLLDLGGATRDLMNTAWYYHRTGMSAEQSLNKAHELSQIPQLVREENKKAYKRLDAYDDNIGYLTSKMDADEDSLYPFDPGVFASAIGPSSRMGAAYQYIVATEFERTGNIDMARETAWNNLNESWSPSGVGVVMKGMEADASTRATKYGVERTLGITTQVANDRLAAFSAAHGLDPATVIVQSDGFTARDSSSWDIMVIDPKTKMPDRLYGADGLPIRWKPNDWIEGGKQHRHDESTKDAAARKAMRKAFDEQEDPYKAVRL